MFDNKDERLYLELYNDLSAAYIKENHKSKTILQAKDLSGCENIQEISQVIKDFINS